LVIGEEENLVLSDGPTQRAAKLLSIVLCPFRGKVVPRVQAGVPKEPERTPMELVVTGTGGDLNLTAAEVPVFRIEVGGEHLKLLNRIEVRHKGSAHVEVVLCRCSINGEAVCGLSLPTDREISRVEIAGRRRAGASGYNHGVRLPGTG
jgi:hypothetical protein